MIDSEVVEKLRVKFSDVHPLIFHRSVEHAKSVGELFDILIEFPQELPVIWDEATRRWVETELTRKEELS